MSAGHIELSSKGKLLKVSVEPKGWVLSYENLHSQTPLSLYAMAKAEGKSSFNNYFAKAMQGLYAQRTVNGRDLQNTPYALLTRDVIEESGKGVDDKGRLSLKVTSFDGIEGWEKVNEVWAPKSGYPVPTGDSDGSFASLFHEGTPVARETIDFDKRKEATKLWEVKGLDPKYLSGFYREHRIDTNKDNGKRFAGRDCHPRWDDGGLFDVSLAGLPSNSGNGRVASLPPYELAEAVMKLEL